MKTNDWDQPEIQYSTGASNQAYMHFGFRIKTSWIKCIDLRIASQTYAKEKSALS